MSEMDEAEINLAAIYEYFTEGEVRPEIMYCSSSKGTVMVTKDGAWLLDDEGNAVAEVDKEDFMKQWMEKFKK